jgi:3'-phosphoadenosine 5'-phosphosulfate sulfotransferase (PAPS reductase)/FAD synthetase
MKTTNNLNQLQGGCAAVEKVVRGQMTEVKKMKNYLSFGGGVNSVALYLLLEQIGMEFEAVFVDHGGDWPETYEYVDYFIQSGRPLTILKPVVQGSTSLIKHCEKYRMIPSRQQRWCTEKWKIIPLLKYFEPPCFSHIGIDAGESHRAKISSNAGVENRYLLIEHGLDREACIRLIEKAGLKNPGKSGCWFCPFQRIAQWRRLRRAHPELWCKAVSMETEQNKGRKERGKSKPFNFIREDLPLTKLIGNREKQKALPGMEELEYPPCQCDL